MQFFEYGLSVALVGIATVFVGLIILIGLIKLMEMIMTGGRGRERRPKAPAPAAAPAPVAEEAVEETDDDELIAVIAAAVAAAMEQAGEENTTGFVVRSIRRINNAPAWNRAGREERGLQPHVIGAASLNIQFCEEDLHYA